MGACACMHSACSHYRHCCHVSCCASLDIKPWQRIVKCWKAYMVVLDVTSQGCSLGEEGRVRWIWAIQALLGAQHQFIGDYGGELSIMHNHCKPLIIVPSHKPGGQCIAHAQQNIMMSSPCCKPPCGHPSMQGSGFSKDTKFVRCGGPGLCS